MKSLVLLSLAATLALGVATGCSKAPDPSEDAAPVKGLPPGGVPADAAKPRGPFDGMPDNLPKGPLGKRGGRAGAGAAPGAAPAAGQ